MEYFQGEVRDMEYFQGEVYDESKYILKEFEYEMQYEEEVKEKELDMSFMDNLGEVVVEEEVVFNYWLK